MKYQDRSIQFSLFISLSLLSSAAWAIHKKDLPPSICATILTHDVSPEKISLAGYPSQLPPLVTSTTARYISEKELSVDGRWLQSFQGLNDLIEAKRIASPPMISAMEAGLIYAAIEVSEQDFKRMIDDRILTVEKPTTSAGGGSQLRFKLLTKKQIGQQIPRSDQGSYVLFFDPVVLKTGQGIYVDHAGPNEYARSRLLKRTNKTLEQLTIDLQAGNVEYASYGFAFANGPFPMSYLRGIDVPKSDSGETLQKILSSGLADRTDARKLVHDDGKIPRPAEAPNASYYVLRKDVGIADLFTISKKWSERELEDMDIARTMTLGVKDSSPLAKPGFWLTMIGSKIKMVNYHGDPIDGTLIDVSFTTGLDFELALTIHDKDNSIRTVTIPHLTERRKLQSFHIEYLGLVNEAGKTPISLEQALDPKANDYFWKIMRGVIKPGAQRLIVTE